MRARPAVFLAGLARVVLSGLERLCIPARCCAVEGERVRVELAC